VAANDPTKNDRRPTKDGHEEPPTNDAHAHAHADAHAHDDVRRNRAPGSFPHEKLDAYRVALEIVGLSTQLAEKIPRGHRSVADHLLRAASNTVLLIAEGANRRGAGLKRQRFVEGRGECAEVAAAADLLKVLRVGSTSDSDALKSLAGRVSAMLTRLIARLE